MVDNPPAIELAPRSAPQVYAAINSVQAAMSLEGIAKSHENSMQKYKFRGIDDCYAAVGPHLAKHGLCILPRVLDRDVREVESKNGGILFYTTLRVEFDFVSVEDGSKHTVCMVGEAMDSGDKSSNKAMSAALKYCFFQVFCIPTEGDNDADAFTYEIAGKKRPEPAKPKPEPKKELPEPRKDVKLASADQIRQLAQFGAEPTGKKYLDKVLANVGAKTTAQLEEGYAAESIKWINAKLDAAAKKVQLDAASQTAAQTPPTTE
jgi:ERF superfamily protein